ncbi:MAG TPA: NAD(P)H-dependent glycerol-3-phosphate dehydrogenase [Steroidobacteraceae bacterium]|nr:NAD(P)H-dependent glycerol-3-phosphate dehydrogenase [Steroidobacteraceae bacterium]
MALPETNPQDQAPIAILGAGSWGTALAIQFARAGHVVRLWGREPRELEALERDRRNRRYLPDAPFPPTLRIEADLKHALGDAADVLIAVPSHGFRQLLQQLKPHLQGGMRLAWATKGFEQATGKLPHEIAAEVLGERWPIAVLSGPTFAREVGAGLPTAMTVASPDETFAAAIARNISGLNFRAYTSNDVIGVEVGGAVKNVLAIGAGIADGMGYGANTRIALITRGLAEMTRLGEALGARRDTFMGLAGLGDLVLTCTDNQSRNRRFGMALAKGQSAEEALAEISQVVEGYSAAKAVHGVAARLGIEMPICEATYRVLYEGLPVKQAVQALMAREIRPEHD